jgi:hypothetical protein
MRNVGYLLLLCGALALPACRSSADADWAGRELKPTEGAVAGLSFTIGLPDGLKKSDALSSETSTAWEAAAGKSTGPSISVAKLALPPATLKDAVTRSGGAEIAIARQEAIEGGGFIVTGHSNDKGLVKVDVYKKAGEEALWCSAMQAKEGGLSKFEESKAWLEKVCLSMAPKGGAAAKGAEAGAPSGVGSAGSAAAQANVTPEMKDFLAGFGSSAKVAESLKKHGAPDLATKDMQMYDLTDPAVLKAELHGAKMCFTIEAKAGATARTYLVCWDGGKIVSIDDMGMR